MSKRMVAIIKRKYFVCFRCAFAFVRARNVQIYPPYPQAFLLPPWQPSCWLSLSFPRAMDEFYIIFMIFGIPHARKTRIAFYTLTKWGILYRSLSLGNCHANYNCKAINFGLQYNLQSLRWWASAIDSCSLSNCIYRLSIVGQQGLR